jgi:hypothetical protein
VDEQCTCVSQVSSGRLLAPTLDLVVTADNVRVAGRSTRLFGTSTHTGAWCRSGALGHWRGLLRALAVLCPVVRTSRLFVADVVVRDPLVLGVAYRLVIVISFWVDADDVPGVKEARYVAQHAEEDVNERVGRAYPGFDPDWCLLEKGRSQSGKCTYLQSAETRWR